MIIDSDNNTGKATNSIELRILPYLYLMILSLTAKTINITLAFSYKSYCNNSLNFLLKLFAFLL